MFKIVIDKQKCICIKKKVYLPSMWVDTSPSLSKSVLLSTTDFDLVVLVVASLTTDFSYLEPFCIFIHFEGSECCSEGVLFFFSFMYFFVFDPSYLPSISMTSVINLGLCRALVLSLNLLLSLECIFLVPATVLASYFFLLLLISYPTSLTSFSSYFVG